MRGSQRCQFLHDVICSRSRLSIYSAHKPHISETFSERQNRTRSRERDGKKAKAFIVREEKRVSE
jgi:hypothetical protein